MSNFETEIDQVFKESDLERATWLQKSSPTKTVELSAVERSFGRFPNKPSKIG